MKYILSLTLLARGLADIDFSGNGHGQIEFMSSSGTEMTLAKNINSKELTLDGDFTADGTVAAAEVSTPSVKFPDAFRNTNAEQFDRPWPFDNTQKKAINHQTLGTNLLSNGQMRQFDETGRPKGYAVDYYYKQNPDTFGNVTSVSPLFRCFEGLYRDTTAEGFFENTPHSTTCDEATAEMPYYFGRYDKGKRLERGGIADGWMGFGGGRLARIQGNKAPGLPKEDGGTSSECVRLHLPINSMMTGRELRIRMWVKITKGRIGWSTSVCGGSSWVTKEMADASQDGWYFYDSMLNGGSLVARFGGSAHQGNLVFRGENPDGTGEFDITIGMLHVSQPEWQDNRLGQSSDNWQGSYLDNLATRGIVIDVETGNMGIGMSGPSSLPTEKLVVNGDIRTTGLISEGPISISAVTTTEVSTPSVMFPDAFRNTNAEQFDRPWPFDNTQKKAINHQTLGTNLLSNGQMRQFDETGRPKGYAVDYYYKQNPDTFGNVTSVSPLFRCFEGLYRDTTAEGFFENTPHSTTCDEATAEKPYYFGRYDKGKRLERGGIADGWMGFGGGRLARIQGNKAPGLPKEDGGTSSECVRLHLPINSMMTGRELRIRMWVKITKGRIGWSTSVCGGSSWVTKEMADASQDGWYFYDSMLNGGSLVARFGGSAHQGNLVFRGENPDGTGEFDITIGMLHVSQPEWQDNRLGQSSDNWQGSYLDNLATRGIVIDVETGNMGIGMSGPSSLPTNKLDVNGGLTVNGIDLVARMQQQDDEIALLKQQVASLMAR